MAIPQADFEQRLAAFQAGWSYHMMLWFVEAMNGVVICLPSPSFFLAPLSLHGICGQGMVNQSTGSNVVINGAVSGFDLVEIGDVFMINMGAAISASTIEDGMISFRHVKVGEGVTLGTRAIYGAVGDSGG